MLPSIIIKEGELMSKYGINSSYGVSVFSSNPITPFENLNKITLQEGTYDDVHLVAKQLTDGELLSYINSSNPAVFDGDTIFLAKFEENLEAGSIDLRGIEIVSWKVMKKYPEDLQYKTIAIVPKTTEQFQTCEDAKVIANKETIYAVAPIGVNGVEGEKIFTTTNVSFDGWWLIDPDDTNSCINFLYNLDDSNITIEEDRVELETFSKYAKVYYTSDKKYRKGTLGSLFVPEGNYTGKEQIDTLNKMIDKRKPLILKDGRGRIYLVNVASPQETVIARPKDFSKVTINWVEVGEV